jgi:4-amino-4-deoxy-L-arabinose transferase-like glycosyltransferase
VPLAIWWAEHLAWLFPWSFFLGFGVREIPSPRSWGKSMSPEANARLMIFLWVAIILAFFSIESGSRMEYYSLPAWPALALMIGIGMARAEERHSRWLSRLQAGLAAVGFLAACVLGYVLWVSRDIHASGDISHFLDEHRVAFYRVSMAHFLDLTPDSFALLRGQAGLTILLFTLGFGAAWLLRRRGRHLAANLTLAVVMSAFLLTANWAFKVFEPYLSSYPLAAAVNSRIRPQDQIAIYGEYGAASGLSFYTHRRAWIYNGDYNNLAMGAIFPDAPQIFLNDRSFPEFWNQPDRVFLEVPSEQRAAALSRLPPNDTWLFARSGGKFVFVNHPLSPDERTLAQLDLPARAASP